MYFGSAASLGFARVKMLLAIAVILLVAVGLWQLGGQLLQTVVMEVVDHEVIATHLVEDPAFADRVARAITDNPEAVDALRGPRGAQGPAGIPGPPGPSGARGPEGVKGQAGNSAQVRNETCGDICNRTGKACVNGQYPDATNEFGYVTISCDTPVSHEHLFSCECNTGAGDN